MSRKSTLDALFGTKFKGVEEALETKSAPSPVGNLAPAPVSSTPTPLTAVNSGDGARIRSGAIGAMGASLQHLQESAREAETLRQSLLAAESIVLLDPTLIDSAPIADRFLLEHDPAERDLTESIRESGQQVPVLVRPHPKKPGRWQAAYGHRRIRACRTLGQPVKAIVRELSDTALAVAQGKENLERRDLSFIERVFFAAGLEDAGFDRHIVMQALGVHKADVSRYIALADRVPITLVYLIGPAPKAGRARWTELADKLKPAGIADLLAVLPQLTAFQSSDSDARFRFVLDRLSGAAAAKAAPPKKAVDTVLADAQGRAVATLTAQGQQQNLALNEEVAPGFAAHVAASLPELYRQWQVVFGQSALGQTATASPKQTL